jgi:hypothetical protein
MWTRKYCSVDLDKGTETGVDVEIGADMDIDMDTDMDLDTDADTGHRYTSTKK